MYRFCTSHHPVWPAGKELGVDTQALNLSVGILMLGNAYSGYSRDPGIDN
jgi:hypothetical protein